MEMTNIDLKKLTLNDLEQLQDISRKTFSETFSAENTAENMKMFLEEAFSTEKLTSELIEANSEFYFATIDDRIIGYLKLNFGSSQTELQDEKALEIERIYVLQEFLGKKIGQFLFNKAIENAHAKNADYIWLGVWEKNLRAISFYQKNGFEVFNEHLFKVGDDEQTDLMMKLTLKK